MILVYLQIIFGQGYLTYFEIWKFSREAVQPVVR